MRNRRSVQTIVGRVGADGTIQMASEDFACYKGSAGVFNIIFSPDFGVIHFDACASDQSGSVVTWLPIAGGVQAYVIAPNTLAAQARPFSFVAMGVR
jgi:hypothetical protein